jgi:gluconolactonase
MGGGDMSQYDVLDERFKKLVISHAKLEKLWTGCRWAEGPVYVPSARHLLWSDIPNDRILRFCEDDGRVSVFQTPVGFHNGHTIDAEGRVIACEHGGRRVSRLDFDGRWRALATHYEGKRFNSPNDVVVKSDGSVWFTDPTYGIDGEYEGGAALSEIGSSNVYRFDLQTGNVTLAAGDRVRPNGLAFSPNEKILYVADTGASHVADTPRAIHAYPVNSDGASLGTPKQFANCPVGLFDGFRIDIHGNVWTSSGDAVLVYAADGMLIGRIPIPELVANVCFGGPRRNRLYVAAQTSLYSIFVNSHGAGWKG